MPEQIAMTPDGSVEWTKEIRDGSSVYVAPGLDFVEVEDLVLDEEAVRRMRCVGEGDRLVGAAKTYKSGQYAIRDVAVGRVFHADLAWIQANIMLKEALASSPKAIEARVGAPDYFAMKLGSKTMRTIMSYEGCGRSHPDRIIYPRAYERAQEASEIAFETFRARWGEKLPVRIDFKPSNILVGTKDVVILDADPLPGWYDLGI